MAITCLFCDNDVTSDGEEGIKQTRLLYMCKRCGFVYLEEVAADDFPGENFPKEAKSAIRITLRNEWERSGKRPSKKALTLGDIKKIVSQYTPLEPLEKLDRALINFEQTSQFVGAKVNLQYRDDYPLYYCDRPGELEGICHILFREGFTHALEPIRAHTDFSITAKGYQKLREIKKPGRDSNQCFVAMWFTPEMNDVYERAIKSAIEFKEEGKDTSRFKAIKIDNVEHANDINDEIIAQIRRSRFMVCDLTGYRGGVYFEAGFAHGLGLDVIYTCREDWIKECFLKDEKGQEVVTLFDDNGHIVKIRKEGIHFDLAHRNRIEWSANNLDDLKLRLENRIRALIY